MGKSATGGSWWQLQCAVSFSMTMLARTAAATTNLLQRFRWDVFEHPAYSPDLAPSDFHLFGHMKRWLGGQRFGTDETLQTGVERWLQAQAATFCQEGIDKLV